MVWDKGSWLPEQEEVAVALTKGDLKFTLRGKKLRGSWVLVRTRGFGRSSAKSWLLIKHRDRHASKIDITRKQPKSVLTKRLLADIARAEGGEVSKAATGDPMPSKDSLRATELGSRASRKR